MLVQKTPRTGRRLPEDEIIGFLKEAAAGAKRRDLCQRHGVSERAFYRWKVRFRGFLRMLSDLEDENRRLRTLVSDLALDNRNLKELIGHKEGGAAHPPLNAPPTGAGSKSPIDHRSHLSTTAGHHPGLQEHHLIVHAPMEAPVGAN
jgi:putative transposase